MRRKQRHFGLATIPDAMTGALEGIQGGQQIRESMALVYWPEVVGENGARATEAEKVSRGKLVIRTKNSIWSQELTLLKPDLIEKLNRRLGEKLIVDIIYKANGLTKVTIEKVDPNYPTEEEMALLTLSEDEQAEIDIAITRLNLVTDDKMRESLSNRILRDKKIRHWRLEHGWHKCKGCSALHKEEGLFCPVCRLGNR